MADQSAEYVRAATTCLLCEVSYYCEVHDADIIAELEAELRQFDGNACDV